MYCMNSTLLRHCAVNAATARHLSLSTCCLANLLSYVRTVDSDVAVLAIHFFPRLSLSELRVCLGSGKKVCDTPSMHDIRTHLGSSRSLALPLFHALTGCDTTSQFLECGKKTAETLSWQNTPGLTETLVALTVNGLVPAAA